MPRRRHFLLSALLAIVAVAAFGTAASHALLKKVSVSGTIEFAPPSAFSGEIKSKQDACESGARVNLLRYQNKNDTTAERVGTDKSNRRGRWDIMVPNAQAGEYQLQILGRKARDEDVLYKCKVFLGARIQF
jgi:spermidine/putrescine-binding protein